MTKTTKQVRKFVALLLAATLVVSAGAAGVALGATTTEVSVTPDTEALGVGETTEFDIVVETTDGDVGAQDIDVELTNPSVATITEVSLAGDPGFDNTDVADDGSSASFAAVYGNNPITGASPTIATVTVEGTAEGETGIELTSVDLSDEPGNPYTISATNGATLTVEANDAPTADAGADQTVDAGSTVELSAGGSSDVDGFVESYSWTQTGGPDVSLSGADTATPTFTAPDVSAETTLTFEVEVTDDDGASATDTVAVVVQPEADEPAPDPASFQVSGLSAPSEATQGETITVAATVTNEGDQSGEQTVEFQLGGETVAEETVSLDADDSQPVSFEVTVPSDLAPGTYTHGVYTEDDSATAQITVTAADDAPDQPVPTGPETDVSLSPVEETVSVGGQTTYEVVVENADGGVGAVDLAVSVDDPSTAEIVSIDTPNSAFEDGSVADDGSSASVQAVGIDTADSGPVTVATVTVEGAAVGSSGLSLDVTALGTESGQGYQIGTTTGATLVVQPADFLVSNLDAPDSVVRGESVTATVDVTNDGNIETTKTVEFRFDLNGDGTLAESEVVATEEVTLAPGETQSVSLTATVPADAAPGEYAHGVFTPDDSTTASVQVTLPQIDTNYDGPPQDLNSDGVYEDVNGDGELTTSDVQALFVNRDADVVSENPALFDYNGNGQFNVVDVQMLFAMNNQNE